MSNVDFRGAVILGPLTKGGNLPFRRLCVDLGAQVTTSEMAYARQVLRGSPTERALLRRHESEPCFGVQLATARPEEAVEAGKIAVQGGARFVDLNVGCPIHDVVRRGMGATLMRRPAAFGRVVEAMAGELEVPVTVKLRIGWREGQENAIELGRIAEQAGAAAVALHARTREQRYTKAADWSVVAELAAALSVPVIGNGDLLTHYEVARRREESGCAAVMLARGALIKPWLFGEVVEGREFELDAAARVDIYLRLARYMVEHFRDDAKGRKRVMFFLPWHFDFFCRYRPLPEAAWGEPAREHPLLQTRMPLEQDLSLAEAVLRDPRAEVHAALAEALWDAVLAGEDAAAALGRVVQVGERLPPSAEAAGEIATAHG